MFIILFFALQGSGQNKISSYEYWFDNNDAGKTTITVNPVSVLDLESNIPTAGLLPGLHVFHIRFKDNNSKYSTTVSQFFQKLPSSNSITKKIVGYEYWFDNNYGNKISNNVTPQSGYQLLGNFDASALHEGMHIFHIRFKDDGGGWSTVLSQFIQKVSGSSGIANEIKAYEYWFDNNYAGKVYQSVTAQSQVQILASVNANSLANGLHIFHVRFIDKGNIWSGVQSSFFQKSGNGSVIPNLITAYRYWSDSANTNIKDVRLQTPVNPYLLNTSLDLSYLTKGNHTIHFQFLDTLYNWSSITTDTIYKYPTVKADFTTDKAVVCDSGTIVFTNKSFDADTYHWSFGDGDTSNLANPEHFYKTFGTHQVTLTARDTTVGMSKTISIDILVTHSPVVNLGKDTTICANKEIILDAGQGFDSYEWNNGKTTSAITVTAAGIYYVAVTNSSGCSSIDSVKVIVDPCLGISEQTRSMDINIFPNPNNGLFFLRANADFNDPACISITDISGRIVFRQENILLLKDELVQIKPLSLNMGIYMLFIVSKSKRTQQKLIINSN